jgi:hypothetical protein
MRARQKRRYYDQFQKNNPEKIQALDRSRDRADHDKGSAYRSRAEQVATPFGSGYSKFSDTRPV